MTRAEFFLPWKVLAWCEPELSSSQIDFGKIWKRARSNFQGPGNENISILTLSRTFWDIYLADKASLFPHVHFLSCFQRHKVSRKNKTTSTRTHCTEPRAKCSEQSLEEARLYSGCYQHISPLMAVIREREQLLNPREAKNECPFPEKKKMEPGGKGSGCRRERVRWANKLGKTREMRVIAKQDDIYNARNHLDTQKFLYLIS